MRATECTSSLDFTRHHSPEQADTSIKELSSSPPLPHFTIDSNGHLFVYATLAAFSLIKINLSDKRKKTLTRWQLEGWGKLGGHPCGAQFEERQSSQSPSTRQ